MGEYSPKVHIKVRQAVGEFKKGDLKTSSGRTVKSRQQAIAIGLSEARQAGARVPEKDDR